MTTTFLHSNISGRQVKDNLRSAFDAASGLKGDGSVATESSEYAAVVRGAWRARWGAQRVLMRDIGTRVSGKRLNAMVYVDRQLDVLQDVFFDIQLMARCDYFLHSASAVSEAVIYSNLALLQ